MSKFMTDAITLKSYSLGESDKIVVMYSKDRGILRCVAKGVKKPSSRLGSCLDNLIASRFLIAKGKKLDVISQSDSLNTFAPLRKDFAKLSYAMYCADLLNAFAMEEDAESERIYSLFCGTLDAISLASASANMTLCVIKFQMNLMEILGYGIEFDECVKCFGSPTERLVFSGESGGIVCHNCSNGQEGPSVHSKLVGFMKRVRASEFSNKYFKDEELKNEITIKFCFNLMKDYITQRSPKKLKAQEFLEIAQ